MKTLNVIDLGIFPYEDTRFLQKEILAEKKVCRGGDYLLLVEHPNIFTIGRTGSRKNILADEDVKRSEIQILDADRGGDITFHGIGQLVAYPIFDLNNHKKDIRLFIRNLEHTLELTVSEYGLVADKEKRYTGLWVGGSKIGFIGIGISDWITYHGISLNANVDLRYFSIIRPCGIDGLRVSSLEGILKEAVDIDSLKEKLTKNFCGVFGFEHLRRHSKDAFMAKEGSSRY